MEKLRAAQGVNLCHSLAIQRYEFPVAVYEYFVKYFELFSCPSLSALPLAPCPLFCYSYSATVLEKTSPHPKYMSIYLYIFIYINI